MDTPGAYPGLDAEERGQAEAIAYNLREMAGLRTPIVVTVTGEGGSGGALAIAVGDRVNMLEHAVYSVISPEGCASILWRDPSRAEEAATAMKITAHDLKAAGPRRRDRPRAAGRRSRRPRGAVQEPSTRCSRAQLEELRGLDSEALADGALRKFRDMGRLGQEFLEVAE